MYVYLREAYSPLWGFLYGWTLFTVIQTGTIAAVAVAFARFLSILCPGVAENNYLIPPVHLSAATRSRSPPRNWSASRSSCCSPGPTHAASNTARSCRTSSLGKIGALAALILAGSSSGWNSGASQSTSPTCSASAPSTLRSASRRAASSACSSPSPWPNPAPCSPPMPGTTSPSSRAKCATRAQRAAGARVRLLRSSSALYTGERSVPGGAAAIRHPERSFGPRGHGDAASDLPGLRPRHHGHLHHDLHLRLREQPGAGRSPRLLRHGEGRPFFNRPAAQPARVPGMVAVVQGSGRMLVLPRTYDAATDNTATSTATCSTM